MEKLQREKVEEQGSCQRVAVEDLHQLATVY